MFYTKTLTGQALQAMLLLFNLLHWYLITRIRWRTVGSVQNGQELPRIGTFCTFREIVLRLQRRYFFRHGQRNELVGARALALRKNGGAFLDVPGQPEREGRYITHGEISVTRPEALAEGC